MAKSRICIADLCLKLVAKLSHSIEILALIMEAYKTQIFRTYMLYLLRYCTLNNIPLFRTFTVLILISSGVTTDQMLPSLNISMIIIIYFNDYMSRVMRKPFFCICENKDADQLRGNREADQRLCFRHTDSAIPLLSESEVSSL